MKKSESLKKKIEMLEKQIMAHIEKVGWKNRGEKYEELRHECSHAENALKYWVVREVKRYCNHHGYTDAYPFEVVRVVSNKCVEVRAMKHELVKAPQEFHPGGFCGHYSDNYAQEHSYESNPEAVVQKVRWSESNRQWQQGKYMRFVMADKPCYFHDYNF